jgi:hypothetical protein
MEIPDLKWKFWIKYGNSGSDMEIPDLKWKFGIRYGNSGSDMEILDLKWKFRIRYGHLRFCFSQEQRTHSAQTNNA